MVDWNKIKYIGKKYYYGSLVKWLIKDKKGRSVYCDQCGNIANDVKREKIFRFININVPICKLHAGKYPQYNRRQQCLTKNGN